MQTTQLPAIELEFREGSSDKVYQAAIEGADDRFVVNFAYGHWGATLNTGTKTQQPVPYDEALSIYEKLVNSKTTKGYKPAGSSTGMVTNRESRDTGLRTQLLNPFIEDEAQSYLANPAWCAKEKFNGMRMLMRKTGETVMAANRHGLSIGFPSPPTGGWRFFSSQSLSGSPSASGTTKPFDEA